MSGRSAGRAVVGSLLVVAGVVWLLRVLDVLALPASILAPLALVGVGIALIATARSGAHPLLVVAGLLLVVAVATQEPVRSLSVSDRAGGGYAELQADDEIVVRPEGTATLAPSYERDAGRIVLDLTAFRVSTPQTVDVRVGAGRIVVLVGPQVSVEGTARVGVGTLSVPDRSSGGLALNATFDRTGTDATTLTLRLRVGVGGIDVRATPAVPVPRPDVPRRDA